MARSGAGLRIGVARRVRARDGDRDARAAAVARARAGARAGSRRRATLARRRSCGAAARDRARARGVRAVDRAQLRADGEVRARQRQRRLEPRDRNADDGRRLAGDRRPRGVQGGLRRGREGRVLRTRRARGDRRATRCAGSRARRRSCASRSTTSARRPGTCTSRTPSAFRTARRWRSASLETLASRLLLLAALVTVAQARRSAHGSLREAVTGFGLLACFLAAGAMGYLACALAILLLGPRELRGARSSSRSRRRCSRDGRAARRVLRRGALRARGRAVRHGARVRAPRS